ncbi:ABC transporter ATP-binding protein [Salinactinospora qingdaonensis]|uniref:ABC transporter ATP-binding protein n=2 Tax=Salinactinospora qingdaonensis TaxID=702744 RepID=A0ABP7GDP9_9ACTN
MGEFEEIMQAPEVTETEAPAGAVLALESVCRDYGQGAAAVRAVDGVTLRVGAGEFVVLTGVSGSGKSTLLALAGYLQRPSSGTVWLQGRDLSAADATELAAHRRRIIGYVFQEYNLVADLTAAENTALPLELEGTRPRVARRRAVQALEEVGVGELADRFPEQTSGGQRQRVAIARALVGDKRLILADEPTGALDSESSAAVMAALVERTRERGISVVVATHDPAWLPHANRVLSLRDGHLSGDGEGR